MSNIHHYERENAKEWQMDLGEGSKSKPAPSPSPDEALDDAGWTEVKSSKPALRKRFKQNHSKAPTPVAPRSRSPNARPPNAMAQGISTRPPNQAALPAKPPIATGHIGQTGGPRVATTAPKPHTAKARGPPTRVQPRPGLQPRSMQVRTGGPPHLSSRRGIEASKYPTGVTLPRNEDNAAKGAFRKGRVHDAIFVLSKTCEKIEPDRIRMYGRLEEIGVRFETFIRPPQFLEDRTLLLWGNEPHISQTIAELEEWVSTSENDMYGPRETIQIKSNPKNFARTGLLQGKREEQLDKRLREQAKMLKFQKDPQDGKAFAFQGCFLWPIEEVRPQDLLGPSCEAYDPIRTYNHSHILFEPSLSAFKILSNKEAAVQNALQRIEGTMREYVARSGKIYSSHMVQLPKASKAMKEIKMVAGVGGKMPLLTGGPLTSTEIKDFVEEKKILDSSNQKNMRHALRKIIVRLPFYRGQVRMRVVFGTFTLSTFRWPGGAVTEPFSDFIRDVDSTSTKGTLVRDLQFKLEAQELFARCAVPEGPFQSLSSMYQFDQPDELRPIYTGRFKFSSPDTGNVTLEVEFSKVSGGQGIYEVTRSQWTKDEWTEASVPLEQNMMQLNGGSSWRLHITSENILDDVRITPKMADFAASVTYRPPPQGIRPELTGHNVFKFSSNLRYESFEQKTAVQYCHKKHVNWIFELARYDTFTGNITTASEKTQWGASYLNAEWDNILGANLALGIGQSAQWNPWLETFFPKNDRTTNTGKNTGFQDFMQDLSYITGRLDEMKGLENAHLEDEGDQIDTLFA